jgi:POT family proton-dependent oligopeptide transporter
VVKAMSLAFILIGFFYNRDKATTVSQTDATSSAASISIIAVTMLIVGAICAYYGLVHLGGLADGQVESLVIEPTAGQFGSLNALFIFTLAPLFAALWVKLARVNLDPNTPVKFSLGLIQVGLGFGALLIGALTPNEAGKVAWVWLMLAYLLHTTGELSLSPVGLSAVTKLSIKSVVSMVMGVWFLATSLSEVVAVLLAKIAALDQQELLTLTVSEQLDKYNDLWTTLLYLGVGFGLVLLLLSPLLKKGMKGIH